MKKCFAASLAILLASSFLLLSSCGDTAEKNTDDTPGVSAFPADDPSGEDESVLLSNVPDDVRFDGEDFRVLYRYNAGSYNARDIMAESLKAEPINDAVYERNLALKERFGITLTGIPKDNVADTTRREVMGKGDEFDVVFDSMCFLFPLSLNNSLYNWNRLSYVDMEKPYWDHNAHDELSIGNHLFLSVGNISMSTSSYARHLYFNKKIAVDNHLEFPYEDAKAGTWTLDKMLRMVEAVSEDLNGDGVLDYNDRFGIILERYTFFLCGCGVLYTENNEEGLPEVAFVSERTVDVLNDLKVLFKDKKHTIGFDDLSKSGADMSEYSHVFDYGRGLFAQDHFLFLQNGPSEASQFVDMSSPYGILPNPKYDEHQENYYHMMDEFACAWAIPSTAAHVERTDALMEYWSYISDDLVNAFYEITLKSKRLDAPDDAAMLDIFRDSIRYEISTISDMGIFDCLDTAFYRTDLMSSYNKSKSKIEKKIDSISKRITRLDP